MEDEGSQSSVQLGAREALALSQWTGIVVDGVTHERLSSAYYAVTVGDPFLQDAEVYWRKVGSDGVFCPVGTPGVSVVHLSADGYGRSLISPGEEEGPHLIPLYREASCIVNINAIKDGPFVVSVSVADYLMFASDAKPTFGHRLSWVGQQLTPKRFLIEGLPPLIDLHVDVAADGCAPSSRTLAIEPGETGSLEVALFCDDSIPKVNTGYTGVVRGTTLYGNGEPAPGIDLWLLEHSMGVYLHPSSRLVHSLKSDAAGEFLIGGLPDGQYLIVPAQNDAQSGLVPRGIPFEIVTNAKSASVDVLCVHGEVIDVAVLDPRGSAAHNAEVVASRDGEFCVAKAKDGIAHVGPLEGGPWVLVAYPEDHESASSLPVSARAGEESVLQLRAGAGLRLTFLCRGKPVSDCEVRLLGADGKDLGWRRHTADKDGVFLFGGVPLGTATVFCRSEQYAALEQVEVTEGECALTFHLIPGATIVIGGDETRGAYEISVQGVPIEMGVVPRNKKSIVVPAKEVRVLIGAGESRCIDRALSLLSGETYDFTSL